MIYLIHYFYRRLLKHVFKVKPSIISDQRTASCARWEYLKFVKIKGDSKTNG